MKNLEIIRVENIRSYKCEAFIKKHLIRIKGVTEVAVLLDQMSVIVAYEQVEMQNRILDKLRQLGYPEIGTGSWIHMIRSYFNCFGEKVSKAISLK